MKMANAVEIREAIGLNAQRASRQLTKIYGEALKPVGLTINQFGLLAYLYGAKLKGEPPKSIRALAEFTGLDPATLRRDLKPLAMRGWITSVADMTDRRRRAISITVKGRAQLRKAVRFWRRAQTQIRDVLGVETAFRLSDILDRASMKLRK